MVNVATAPTARLEQKIAARTENAVKVYGKGKTEVRALDGVSVEFGTGRYTAVMGPSGSGKSTLLHCVAGLDSLTSGRAFIGDADLGGGRQQAAGSRLGAHRGHGGRRHRRADRAGRRNRGGRGARSAASRA